MLGSNKYAGCAPLAAPKVPIAVAPPPPSDQILKNIQGGINEAISRLNDAISRASGFADYMLGAQPEQASAGCAAPTPFGIAHNLQESVSTLHSLIGVLNDKLARLDHL